MRRVMVTGATTLLGVRLVEALLKSADNDFVLAVGREPAVATDLPLKNSSFQYVQADLTRARSLRRLIYGPVSDLKIDTIVHMAAHRSAREGGKRIHSLNVESTRLLLQLAEEHRTIRRFVFRSHGEIYRIRAEEPVIVGEEHPLELSPEAPQWVRDRVESDLTVCTRMGLSALSLVVLRSAECLAPNIGSQLYDYISSRACLRPIGYDPMLNIISAADFVRAIMLSLRTSEEGIFNVPGKDTLPLSELIARRGKRDVPMPGFLLGPAYDFRSLIRRQQFRYDLNHWRFHFGSVLDGRRAKRLLGYEPGVSVF